MKAIFLDTAIERRARIALPRARRRGLHASLRAGLNRVLATLREWRQRQRSRAELARFNERMMHDIGVSEAEVWREINKPFWRQ